MISHAKRNVSFREKRLKRFSASLVFLCPAILAEVAIKGFSHLPMGEGALYDENGETYSSNITQYSSYMQSYFDNLTLNFGKNYAGSCGYVAIELLLSYYDTYLCDSIVPAQYEVHSSGVSKNFAHRRNSPGSVRDVSANPDNLTVQNYLSSHIDSFKSTSLHAKLVSIGDSLGYVNTNASSLGNMCLTDATKRVSILDTYLSTVAGFSSSDYDIHVTSDYGGNIPGHISDIKSIIDNGEPAIISVGESSFGGGHACVAYDYDASGLYCHFGHGSAKTHVHPGAYGYTFTRGNAIWIEFHLQHSHSDNYSYGPDSLNQTAVCWDDTSVNATSAVHDYSYAAVSAALHSAICDCGNSYQSLHVIPAGISYYFGGPRYYDCIYCGWPVDLLTGVYFVEGSGLVYNNGNLIPYHEYQCDHSEITGGLYD